MAETPPTDPKAKCKEMLAATHEQILEMSSGGSVTSIGFNNRNVSYRPPSYRELIKLYNRLYDSCGDETDLPDLRVQRGRAMTARLGGG